MALLDAVNPYEKSILQWAGTRRFCVTEYGRIGWVPLEAVVEDIVCVFTGAEVPHLLRIRDDGRLILVGGACYIHGQWKGSHAGRGRVYAGIRRLLVHHRTACEEYHCSFTTFQH